jgi:Fe-S-cluster containining protein
MGDPDSDERDDRASDDASDPRIDALAEKLVGLGARADGTDRAINSMVRRLTTLLDVLVARGALAPGHLRMLDKIGARVPIEPRRVHLNILEDKYQVESSDVDCASLVHLCKARCCTFHVKLGPQDVAERILEWELLDPYMLKRGPDGEHCTYLTPTGCSVYEHRPGTCRRYDCREDSRVWIDFEQRIPAP